MPEPRLHLCIDARLPSGQCGGVEQFVMGLVSGLAELDPPERVSVLVAEPEPSWLLPHLRPDFGLLVDSAQPLRKRLVGRLADYPRAARAGEWVRARLGPSAIPVARSSGVIERAGVDLMHFTVQDAFLTSVPSIFHPHDLQHRHLPELFSELDRLRRERRYRVFCEHASMVAVTSPWGKADLVRTFGLPASKIEIVRLAPPVDAFPLLSEAEVDDTLANLALPKPYLLYPAQTWRHKNHERLFEALARVRARQGRALDLVCTGKLTDHHPRLVATAAQLGLTSQIHFMGYVAPAVLQALYRRATAVVVPTLFEAGSFPVWEAMRLGCPVACSNVTSLPEQVGDAGLLFDPRNVEQIAHSILSLSSDDALRARLRAQGRARVAELSWRSTSRLFLAHYRRLANRGLGEEDVALLNTDREATRGAKQPG